MEKPEQKFIKDEYRKKLYEEGLLESDIEGIMSNLAMIDEEQAHNALHFETDYDVAIKTGFSLDEQEIIDLSKSIEEIKNPVEGVTFANESGEIDPNSILLVHATNFVPKKENGKLIIDSTGNADPKNITFASRKDAYREVAGQNNYRFTIHFGMVGGQASHQEITESGEIDYSALEKRAVFIILPLGGAINSGNNLLNFGSSDTFFWDKVILPPNSIIILKKEVVHEISLRSEDFDKYQIIFTDENPADVYKKLLNGKLKIEGQKVVDLTSGNEKKLKLKSGAIFASDKAVHAQTIFKRIEAMSYGSLLIKGNGYDGLNSKEHIKFVATLLLGTFMVNMVEPLKKLFESNHDERMNLTEGIRKNILLKIQPVLRDDLKKLVGFCKPLIDVKLEKILSGESEDAAKGSELQQFLDQISRVINVINELNVEIFQAFPELKQLLDNLIEVVEKNNSSRA